MVDPVMYRQAVLRTPLRAFVQPCAAYIRLVYGAGIEALAIVAEAVGDVGSRAEAFGAD